MKKSFPKSVRQICGMLLALLFISNVAKAQQNEGPAVEQWRSFLPYYQVNAIAANNENNEIYCATDYGFFTYNLQDGSLTTYSKVNGMHDIGMSDVAYDSKTGSALLTYTDGNIDIFQNLQFYNVPDLKISQISGNKTIYAAVADNGTGYLATGLGLVLVNIPKREIRFTVPFYAGSLLATVNDVAIENGQVFAATNIGIFRTSTSNASMQDYATWKKLDTRNFTHIGFADNRLYAAEANGNNDSVFVYSPADSSFHFFYLTSQSVTRLNDGLNGVWISEKSPSEKGICYLLDSAAHLLDSINCQSPSDVLALNNGEIWYADNSDYHYPNSAGLRKRINSTESESHTPDGPASAIAFDISAYDGTVWVAHGGYNGVWNPIDDRAMFSVLKENQWKNFSWLSNNQFVQDFIRILYDPQNGHTYAGSMTGGLTDVAPDESFKVYNNGYLPEIYGNPGLYSVSGLALDASGNLWMCSNGCSPELTVMTPDGHWYPMKTISGNTQGTLPHTAADVIADDYGQLWFITTNGNGVIVYNPNGTPENNSDDSYRILKTGKGNGNLPDNDATCIAKTKDGAIWIGTANGIGIVNCPGQVISGQCETSLDPVKVDAFPGQWLFTGQAVSAIAVDAANRKWVGTGNGVWLLNTDGDDIKTIYRFTTDNSPLPSNQIQRINIDPVTGDVYISTDKGFVAFRSTATEPTDDDGPSKILVYPNPVPSGYQGMIAVRGVPDNADVRFTDITGKLVYKTTAFGGQAVWNGQDYTGHKVQSGVYLIFIVGGNNGQKEVGKVMIQH